MSISQFIDFLLRRPKQARHAISGGKNPSFTKKGPGRPHQQGKKQEKK